MTALSTPTFAPPSPGTWSFDASHQTQPVPLLFHAALESGSSEGFRQAFAEVGALLETIEGRYLHGWFFQCPRPVGAPPGATGSPPKWVFKALLKLHPELRARVRKADTVWSARPWEAAARRWAEQLEPDHRASLNALQLVEASTRRPGELVEDVRTGLDLAQALFRDHLRTAIPGAVPVGDLMVQAAPLGVTPGEVVSALAGVSVETTRPLRMLTRVAEALRELDPSLGEGAEDGALMAAIEGHPAAADAWRAYMLDYGLVPIGAEIAGPCVVDMPGPTLTALRRLLRDEGPAPDAAAGAAAAERVSARLPADRRAWWAEAVERAKHGLIYREQSAVLLARACGIVRRSALCLGTSLAGGGALSSPEQVLLLRPEELDAPPPAQVVDIRAAEHAAAGRCLPPAQLGPDVSPPPTEWLPEGAARLTRAVTAYISRFHPEPDLAPAEGDGLCGLPVSPGTYTGRAFVLHDLGDLARVPAGCVLVATTTTASLNPVLPAVGALVTEMGGLICHAAIVSRELGFPGVVGCPGATTKIPDGSLVRVDGSTGRVEVLAARAPGVAAPAARVEGDGAQPQLPDQPGACVPLADADDAARFGGKSRGLALALAAGLRVPGGMALDTGFTEAVAAGDPPHLARLREALRALPGPVAVRSSAPGEDGASASFAGLHHTALGVRGFDAVVEAIAAIWHSAHTPAAAAYRSRMGLSDAPSMAVVVQPMVASQTAGVRFGCDPVSGEDARIIEAAPGLGAVVVDGRVRPDRVRLTARGVEVERVAGDKPVQLLLDAGELREVAVAAPEARAFSLDADLIAAVYALGEACDAHFGGAQDVEWASDGETLWLLQSRPITRGPALSAASSQESRP